MPRTVFLLRYFLLLCLFLVCLLSFSQDRDFIIGKLLDAKTQEPIVFASIRIKDRALGIISNADGGFRIPLKYKEYGDIIEISSMGYKSKEIIIHDFDVNELNVVRLEPALLELDEAIVSEKFKRKKKYISPKNIVRKAIKAIPDNYATRLFSTIGYYRDYQIKDKDSSYLNLNEAILEVFDPGFAKLDFQNTKVRIYNYKQNSDFDRNARAADLYNYKDSKKVIDKAFLHNYGGNEFTILRVHDAIRNYKVNSYDFVNRLEYDLFNNHDFFKEKDTYTEDEVLYTIKIKQNLAGFRVYGKFYISKKDYAIHKMEYALYDRSETNSTGIQNKHGNTNEIVFEVTTEYLRKYSKMYLNYISFHNSFQLGSPPEFIVNEIIVDRQNRCFKIRFNENVDPGTGSSKNNYKFKFKGERLKFKKIVVFENDALLHPDMPTIEITKMLDALANASRKKVDLMKLLEMEFGKIKKLGGGAVLNKRKFTNYQQFREFFVQQLKPNAVIPTDSLFMDKRKPIFEDQPILKPDNFDDYWMNTPLQTLIN